jgi:hypothetical protein
LAKQGLKRESAVQEKGEITQLIEKQKNSQAESSSQIQIPPKK